MILRPVFAGLVFWFMVSANVANAATAERVEGPASTSGGDAIKISGEVLYLAGMAVPMDPEISAEGLARLLSDQSLVCEIQSISQGSHKTASCYVNGSNLSELMIRSGLALAYEESDFDFSASQDLAQKEGLGLWGLSDTGNLATALTNGSLAPRDCRIKGNRSREKPYALKYHVPGTGYYDRTRISIGRGEGWFCSVEAAKAAGYAAVSK